MAKRLIVLQIFILILLSSFVIAADCNPPMNTEGEYCVDPVSGYTSEGYSPSNDAWKDGSTIPDDFKGNINCPGTCTVLGKQVSGKVTKDGDTITLSSGGSIKDMAVTGPGAGQQVVVTIQGPATVKGDVITLTGGKYTGYLSTPSGSSTMEVEGTATCSGGKCDIADGKANGIHVTNGNEILSSDGKITGKAGANCNVNGLIFDVGSTIDINLNCRAELDCDYTINNGGNVKLSQNFWGSVKVQGNTKATLPNGAVLEKGEVFFGSYKNIIIQQNSIVSNIDMNGDSKKDRVITEKGSALEIKSDGKMNFNGNIDIDLGSDSVIDIRLKSPPRDQITLLSSGKCGERCVKIEGRSLTIMGDGNMKLGVDINKDPNNDGKPDVMFDNLVANVKGLDKVTLSEGTFEKRGADTIFRQSGAALSFPPMDANNGLTLASIKRADITINGKPYYLQVSDAGDTMECGTCNLPPETAETETAPSTASTHFFSFVGRAWGWVTGREVAGTKPAAASPICKKVGETLDKNHKYWNYAGKSEFYMISGGKRYKVVIIEYEAKDKSFGAPDNMVSIEYYDDTGKLVSSRAYKRSTLKENGITDKDLYNTVLNGDSYYSNKEVMGSSNKIIAFVEKDKASTTTQAMTENQVKVFVGNPIPDTLTVPTAAASPSVPKPASAASKPKSGCQLCIENYNTIMKNSLKRPLTVKEENDNLAKCRASGECKG